jgi:hypothetical protein
MENIRDFYKDRDNLKTIPTCILDELRKYSTIYSSQSVRGVDGKFVTTYGKKTLPIFIKYNYKDLNFYLLETHFEDIARFFRVTTVLSEDAVILKYNKLHDYYKSYSDGFEKGYNECESLFQVGNSLFKKTDEAIAFNIYSRVVGNKNKGGFSFYRPFKLNEVQRFSWFKNESRFMLSEKRLNFPYFLSLKRCFESGYNGGVFYKCWLLILDNPLLFKTFFLENERTNTLRQPAFEAVKPDEVKKEFKDFFNTDVNVNVIQSIQKEFKDYKGKKMAHLIYLLHKDFKIISYSLNSRNESRKHFVSLLKGTDFRMAGIDNYFELSDVKLENPKFEVDPDYIDIKEKLLKTIK